MSKKMSNKRIVTCAVTGGNHSPTMTDYLPITQEQIANAAIGAAEAGAAVVHIHARNPETGQPSPDLKLFEEIIDRIRDKNKDVIICITTGGGPGMTVEERVGVVPAFKPELASCNLGSINWGLFRGTDKIKKWKYEWEAELFTGENSKRAIFPNTFADLMVMTETMAKSGTKPEFEAYDVGHIYNLNFLLEEGYVKPPVYIQFVPGVLGAINTTPYDMMALHTTAERVLGHGTYEWSTLGVGRDEFTTCTMALLLGGNVRVGMEDNLYLTRGVKAKSNAELVSKMIRIMGELDFEPATPQEAREILSLTK
jgi:uncharacterized protein (DUF849 family)